MLNSCKQPQRVFSEPEGSFGVYYSLFPVEMSRIFFSLRRFLIFGLDRIVLLQQAVKLFEIGQ